MNLDCPNPDCGAALEYTMGQDIAPGVREESYDCPNPDCGLVLVDLTGTDL